MPLDPYGDVSVAAPRLVDSTVCVKWFMVYACCKTMQDDVESHGEERQQLVRCSVKATDVAVTPSHMCHLNRRHFSDDLSDFPVRDRCLGKLVKLFTFSAKWR